MKIRSGKESPPGPSSGDQYYEFKMERYHTQKAKRGSKLYVCDLCQGAFKRSFSLKRHYLRFHINYAYLSPRDLNNCAIVLGDKQICQTQAPLSREPGSFSKLYRCHHCGFLVDTKEDLILHLDTHPIQEELVRGSNRCPRCSTAFSLRKTLRRHIKKNRCRGAAKETPSPQADHEPEAGGKEQPDAFEIEDTEEIDMEVSLSLGCSTSMFRYSCTLCSKMFSSYVNMCRHRSLAHGGYGICSPHFLASRKVKHVPLYRFSPAKTVTDQTKTSSGLAVWAELARSVSDNVNIYVDGRVHHCLPEPEGDHSSDGRSPHWQWKSSAYDLDDVARLDIPVQQAFQRSLSVWSENEEKTSHCSNNDNILSSLGLAKSILKRDPLEEVEPVEFSGEWTRLKKYICSVCLRAYDDLYELEAHQKLQHVSVWCSHYEVDPSPENMPPTTCGESQDPAGSTAADTATDTMNCTKCSYKAQSVSDLHSHVLICSNHVNTSPLRRKRNNKGPIGNPSKGKKWRPAPGGRSRGMKRSFSSTSQTKSKRSKLNEIVPDPAMRRSTRRVLNFTEATSTGKPPKKILRSSVDLSISRTLKSSETSKTKTSRKAENVTSKSKPSSSSSGSSIKPASSTKDKDAASSVSSKKISKSSESSPKSTTTAKKTTVAPKKSSTVVKNPSTTAKKPIIDNVKKSKTNSKPKNPPEVEAAPPKTDLTCSFCQRTFFKPSTLSKHEEVCTSRHPLIIVCDMAAAEERSRTVPVKKTQSRKKPTSAQVKKEKPCKKKPEKSVTENKKNAAKKKTLRGVKDSFTPAAARKGPRKEQKVKKSQAAVKKTIPVLDDKPARPVRSSRKSSLLWSLNCSSDEIEPSFIEALSPEQRIRVAEQKCPFCAKRYVYKSNFKRHLLEGCDTVDEPPEQKPQPKKTHVSKKSAVVKNSQPVKVQNTAKEAKGERKKENNKKKMKSKGKSKGLAKKTAAKTGKVEKTGGAKVPEEPGSQIPSPGETDDVVNTGEEATGEPEQVCENGNPGTSEERGNTRETGEPGKTGELLETGEIAETEKTGELGRIGTVEEPEESVQSIKSEEAVDTRASGEPGESGEIEETEDFVRSEKTEEAVKTREPGEPGELVETKEHAKAGEPGEFEEIEETEEIDAPGEPGEPLETKEPARAGEPGEIEETEEVLGTEEPEELKETEENDAPGEPGEPIETKAKAEEPGESEEIKEAEEVLETEEPEKLKETDASGESGEPLETEEPGEIEENEEVLETEEPEELKETGETAPGEPGELLETKEPAKAEEPGEIEENEEVLKTEEPEELKETEETAASGEPGEPTKAGEPGEIEETEITEETDETDASGESGEPLETEEPEKAVEPGEIEETEDLVQSKHTEEAVETGAPEESGEPGEPVETEEPAKAEEPGEPEEIEETEVVKAEEPEELKETEETDAPGETGEPLKTEEPGELKETEETDASGEPGEPTKAEEPERLGENEASIKPEELEETGEAGETGEPEEMERVGEAESTEEAAEKPETLPEVLLPPHSKPEETGNTVKAVPREETSEHFGLNCPVCNDTMNADDVQQLNEHIKEKHMDLTESQIPLQNQMSRALNGLLEKALDTAMTTGFLRSYSTVTKVPVKIQRLQALALNYRAANNHNSLGNTSE